MVIATRVTPNCSKPPHFLHCAHFYIFIMVADRDFRFGMLVASPNLRMKIFLKGACSGSSDSSHNFTPPEIYLAQLKWEASNFVHKLAIWTSYYEVLALRWLIVPHMVMVGIMCPICKFWSPVHIFGQSKLEISNLLCRFTLMSFIMWPY